METPDEIYRRSNSQHRQNDEARVLEAGRKPHASGLRRLRSDVLGWVLRGRHREPGDVLRIGLGISLGVVGVRVRVVQVLHGYPKRFAWRDLPGADWSNSNSPTATLV